VLMMGVDEVANTCRGVSDCPHDHLLNVLIDDVPAAPEGRVALQPVARERNGRVTCRPWRAYAAAL